MKVAPRFAVYWLPARDHPLWEAGCAWLGRDPEGHLAVDSIRPGTETPRRYGFHATLFPPSRLGPQVDVSGWMNAVKSLAARVAPFPMPALSVGLLGRFIALRPQIEPRDGHPLRELADRCVLELEPFRAPLSPAEFGKRATGLDAGALRRLHLFGYQHVLEGWRFHLTLSDDLPDDCFPDRRATLCRDAQSHFAAALSEPLIADEVGVFVERAPGEPFLLTERIGLGADRKPHRR